ncbi:MAG: YdcF family protein, partial [Deltaproteobacteria bacterium]|nr:YdcF family protein [Deltaproteobacteria bacterium]
MRELAWAVPMALGIVPAMAFRALARGRIYEVEQAPARPVALVLGARLLAPGVPTRLLAHRLEAAQRLLARGAVERLVLTGLAGAPGVDEVGTMRRWLLARGVAEERLVLDGESPRTLVSLERARSALGLSSVAVVTNPFHLPRTLFLARRVGLP